MRRSAIFWDEALLKPFKKVAVLHGHVGQMKWFNVDGHFVKSKIREREVSYEGKNNSTRNHKGIQGGRYD